MLSKPVSAVGFCYALPQSLSIPPRGCWLYKAHNQIVSFALVDNLLLDRSLHLEAVLEGPKLLGRNSFTGEVESLESVGWEMDGRAS